MEQKQYSEKWQKRFAFFHKHGAPGTPEFKGLSFGKASLSSVPFSVAYSRLSDV